MSAVGTDIVDSIFMVKFSLNKVEMYQQLLFYLAKILARPIHHHGPEWSRWGVANYVCTRIHINQWIEQTANTVSQSLSLPLLLWSIVWSKDRSIKQSINQSIRQLVTQSVNRSINQSINQTINQPIILKSIFQRNFKNLRIFLPWPTDWVLQQLTLSKPNQGHYTIIRPQGL